MFELLYMYPASLSCRSLMQSVICVSFRKKSDVQQFFTNASYSGGDLLDQLCYADSNAIQTKYFHNYSQETKGHLKQAIKKPITIISIIIIIHHFNRMTYRLTLCCPIVFERCIKPAKTDCMKLSKSSSHVHWLFEPQQKYRLGTVSIKILGGLNRFYGNPTSLSASVMAQNLVVRSS